MKKLLLILLLSACLFGANSQTKISQMPLLSDPTGSYIPVVKNGINYKVPLENLRGNSIQQSQLNDTSTAIRFDLNGKQPKLNGTGLVRQTGGTTSYDNSTYLLNLTGLLSAGTNTSITGNGTAASPYIINSTGGGSGGGSGVVNSAIQYQLGFYNTSGTAVSGLSLITPNRALVSNANGLPVASTATDIDLVQWHLAAVAQTLTDGATITMNCANGYVGNVTLGGNRNITFSNVPINRQIEINVYQDGSGNRSITFPANTYIPMGFANPSNDTSPNLSTAPNAWDKMYLSYDGSKYTLQFSKNFNN